MSLLKKFVSTKRSSLHVQKALKSICKIVEGYTPESVEHITGVSASEIRQAARMYAQAKSAAILWGMGVTQFYQGVETVRSLTSLAMLTGNLGQAIVGVTRFVVRQRTGCLRIWARCRIRIRDTST